MSIPTGLYTIQNVRFSNYVSIADANDGTPLSATPNAFTTNQKWNVVNLGNNNYNISSQGASSYARTGPRAPAGSTVEGSTQKQQWSIQETRVKNQFTIESTDGHIYWGFTQSDEGTPVTLNSGNADTRVWWIFTSVQ